MRPYTPGNSALRGSSNIRNTNNNNALGASNSNIRPKPESRISENYYQPKPQPPPPREYERSNESRIDWNLMFLKEPNESTIYDFEQNAKN